MLISTEYCDIVVILFQFPQIPIYQSNRELIENPAVHNGYILINCYDIIKVNHEYIICTLNVHNKLFWYSYKYKSRELTLYTSNVVYTDIVWKSCYRAAEHLKSQKCSNKS